MLGLKLAVNMKVKYSNIHSLKMNKYPCQWWPIYKSQTSNILVTPNAMIYRELSIRNIGKATGAFNQLKNIWKKRHQLWQ